MNKIQAMDQAARMANEVGKEVFVVPNPDQKGDYLVGEKKDGAIFSINSKGCFQFGVLGAE